MKNLLENKKQTISIMVLIFIIASIGGASIGTKYQHAISSQQALEVANKNAPKEKEESEYLKGEFDKLNSQFTDSMAIIQVEIKNSNNLNFSSSSKQSVASALTKLSDITKKRDELKKPTIASINNFNKYTDIKDIYSSIDRFSEHFVYAVDKKSESDLKQATEEMKNINNLLDDYNKIE